MNFLMKFLSYFFLTLIAATNLVAIKHQDSIWWQLFHAYVFVGIMFVLLWRKEDITFE